MLSSKNPEFLWIPKSAAEPATVNPRGTKVFLADGLSTFFINGKPTSSDGRKSLPRNYSDCIILDDGVFNNFMLADKLLAKVLRWFEACLSVSNNLWKKLVSSMELPIIFNDSCRVTSVAFYNTDFNLSSYELHKFTFALLNWIILIFVLFQSKWNS